MARGPDGCERVETLDGAPRQALFLDLLLEVPGGHIDRESWPSRASASAGDEERGWVARGRSMGRVCVRTVSSNVRVGIGLGDVSA